MVSTSRVGRCGVLFLCIKVSSPYFCKPALPGDILYTAPFVAIKCELLFLLFLEQAFRRNSSAILNKFFQQSASKILGVNNIFWNPVGMSKAMLKSSPVDF